MINYETILSSFEDKLTLLQWLKKVEEKLAGASLASLDFSREGKNVFLTATFGDGTTIRSNALDVASKGDVDYAYEKLQDKLDELAAALRQKQDALTAGDNITIENNVISAVVPQSGGTQLYRHEMNGQSSRVFVISTDENAYTSFEPIFTGTRNILSMRSDTGIVRNAYLDINDNYSLKGEQQYKYNDWIPLDTGAFVIDEVTAL